MLSPRSGVAAPLVLALSIAVVLGTPGCNRRSSILDPLPTGSSSPTIGPAPALEGAGTGHRPPAGTTCTGRGDCSSDQVCVDGRCRHRETSVAGEILAAAADAQVEAGEWAGALRAYDEAITAFETARAPVPGEILCRAASLTLRTARDAEGRERGARRADQCFRATLSGDPLRAEVSRALARLRFEGLDAALFDRADPAERFFTQEASRPTLDALAIDLVLPDGDESGLDSLRVALAGEAARLAIGECFEQDWEVRHERAASASLVVRYTTHMRDMVTYDIYEGELAFEPTTTAVDGFEPCVAHALTTVVRLPSRSRLVQWQTSLDIAVRVE